MLEKQHSKNNLEFRKVKESDLDALMAIEVVSFTMPWSKKSYQEMMDLENVEFKALFDNQILVGYMLYQYWPNGAELHSIAVSPDHRRKGFGKILLHKLFEWAKKHDITKIFLQVRPSNLKAQNLYKKFGFIIIGRRKEYYTDNKEDAFVMMTDLEKIDL